MQIASIIKSMRLPFLLLTPICVLLGVSVSHSMTTQFDATYLTIIIVAAVCAHISVNLFNEYFDFASGLDLITQKTPFSGGSGALVSTPDMAKLTLASAIVFLLATITSGLYLVLNVGMALLPLGIIGIFLVIFYTRWINKHPWLCLISPGVAFGIIMVAGSQLATAQGYHEAIWLIGLVPFFLINNLLLINQYPDISPDSQIGRHHFPIAFGTPVSNFVYALFVALTIALITYLALTGTIPMLALIALLPLPLSFKVLSGAIQHGENIGRYPSYLATNVLISLSCPALLAMGIFWG